MSSKFVVLGSCGAWPEPGRACSGYLLELEGFRIVIDLGYGTLTRLLANLSPIDDAPIDAVVISHHHGDHMADLHGLFRAIWYSRPRASPIPLYAPVGVWETLSGLERSNPARLCRVFAFHELPAHRVLLGPFHLESLPLTHGVMNTGIRLQSDELVVSYSGDTGPDDRLIELGRGADLFVIEATDQPDAEPRPLVHLRAEQAGRAGALAQAKRLLLTHFWPGTDRAQSRARAATTFDGELLIANEGLEIDL